MYLCENLASLATAFVVTSQEARVTRAMVPNSGSKAKAAKCNLGPHRLVEVCALKLGGARNGALEIMGFLKLH